LCLKVSLQKLELMHSPSFERYSDKRETSLYILFFSLMFVTGEPMARNQVNFVGPLWTRCHPSFKAQGSWIANFYKGDVRWIGDSCSALFAILLCSPFESVHLHIGIVPVPISVTAPEMHTGHS
jgi:hypothetical protein